MNRETLGGALPMHASTLGLGSRLGDPHITKVYIITYAIIIALVVGTLHLHYGYPAPCTQPPFSPPLGDTGA